jgi:hypothetical protein
VFNPGVGMMAVVRGVSSTGRTGIRSDGFLTLERSRVTGGNIGIDALNGQTDVRESLVRQTWTAGTVVRVQTGNISGSRLMGQGVTMVGAGTGDIVGVLARSAVGTAYDADVTLANSVIRGAFNPLVTQTTGAGKANISASYSDYDSGGNMAFPNTTIGESHVTNVGEAGFVDPATGDYRLRPGSPLVDIGDPRAPQGLDLDGNPLVADGDGDAFARRDLGAYELQPPRPGGEGSPGPAADTLAPVISGFRSMRSVFGVARAATPRAARARRGTTLRYNLSENARVVIKIRRRVGARYRTVGTLRRSGLKGSNRVRFTGRIGRRALRAGRYRAVIRATDAAGNRSAPSLTRFRIVR